MVIGGPGSGKSTLARNLGQVTGLPVHHMDRIHWMPGWVERTKADKVPLARAIEAQEAWIFEGGLSATFAERAARADRIIWLDLPSPVRLWRVIKRIAGGYGRTRPDLPADCPERIDLAFLWYVLWGSRRTRARQVEVAAAHSDKFVRLTSQGRIDHWLASVAAEAGPHSPADGRRVAG